MVSSEYKGSPSQTRIAQLPGRSDGIAAALTSCARIDSALPDDIQRLLEQLNSVPDRPIGRG